jgi:transglutaminase-like putative cysteine protease
MTATTATISDTRLTTNDARKQELELLFLTIFSAIPLYATQTISAAPLLAFHAVMLGIVARVALGRGPELIPAMVMRGIAVAYVPFYILDAAVISRSAIAASTHLILFIAAYQPVESVRTRNTGQRLLTASLIFTASVATSTHIAILPFVVLFGFLLLRQLMHLSSSETALMTGAAVREQPSSRAAAFYVCVAILIGAFLFPILPRVRNPLLPGMAGPLSNATSGLSDSINLNEPRTISSDATVVSRVWMGPEAIPFFTPLRLKGAIYERFNKNTWLPGRRHYDPLDNVYGRTVLARPRGFTRKASVQQRFPVRARLLLPVGTYEISGAGQVIEAPTIDSFSVSQSVRESITYDVSLARETIPRRPPRVRVSNYPVTPAVRAMARQIVGNETDPMRQAAAIEQYLSTRFRYVPDPAKIGHAMTVDQFLLQEHRGHCEYFAAGMVALMTALNTPARIVGGFYGGTLNPLTGYFVIRNADAHAWTEVWDGKSWKTFDATPAAMRPGNTHDGLLQVYASAIADWVNYFWDRHILTYGLGDQIQLAMDLIDQLRVTARAASDALRNTFHGDYVKLAAALLLAGLAAIVLSRRRRSIFDLLAAHLHRLGIEVGPAMTMAEALEELRRSHPAAAVELEPLIAIYESERFSSQSGKGSMATIRRRLAEISD